MNLVIPFLTTDLLATFQVPEGQCGHMCSNVRIVDEQISEEFECEVWIYPKGAYNPIEESFIFTDKTSDRVSYHAVSRRNAENTKADYARYIRHLRSGLIRGVGKAILGRSEVIECLQTKRYTVS